MADIKDIETPSGKNKETENFPVGSFLIKPSLRKHVHAFYLFARAADDISDNPLLDAADKIKRLSQMEEALIGQTEIANVTPLRESLKETGITPQHALDLLTAFKRDATQHRYEKWEDLLDYCRYSASPVGRHVLALHGIGESAWPQNDALCSALQIINHIQDCADDYRELDRVYIPLDMMEKNNTSPEYLSAEKSSLALRQTLNDMLEKLAPMMVEAKDFPHVIPDARLKMETSVIYRLAMRVVALLQHRDPLCDKVKISPLSTMCGTLSGIVKAWL
jgi:hydroxysqualene synthase